MLPYKVIKMNQKLNYRPELDGLRAIAVLSVLVYHAKITFFGKVFLPGGFLGVDIFFVLSGFLISSIILNSVKEHNFSFVDFYIGRAKRIIPALSAMLFISFFLAYYYLLPDSFLAYGESLLSSLLFFSNIFFSSEDSYVSESSDLKPLLHTWSLSVEWQFYIIFPLLLFVIIKIAKNNTLFIVCLAWITSFAYSVYLSRIDINSAFYLLPTRSWELLSGTIISLIGRKKRNNIFSFVGISLVIASLLLVTDSMPHPSWPALMLVLGVCLLILYSERGSLTGSLLSLKPIVFIGAISYSLYLFHQPVFVFYRIVFGKIDNLNGMLLIVLSILIAILSYYFIENIFRNKKYNLLKKQISFITIAFLISITQYIKITDGDVSRLSDMAQDIYKNYNSPEFRRLKGQPGPNFRTGIISDSCVLRDPQKACSSGDSSWVTIGDSYAGMYDFYLNEKLLQNGHGLLSLSYEQCPFIDGVWFGNVAECSLINERRWSVINKFQEKKTIVITADYRYFSKGKLETKSPLEDGRSNITAGESISENIVWNRFSLNIKKLSKMGHKIIIIYPVPSVSEDVKNHYFSLIKNANSKIESVIYEKNTRGINEARIFSEKLDTVLKGVNDVEIIRPVDTLCDVNGCQIINKNGGLYNQGSHLSYSGVKLVIDKLAM